jgi:hypothetical protein
MRKYDYVELIEEEFATAAEAQDAALPLAQHQIHVEHNDTLTHQTLLLWRES